MSILEKASLVITPNAYKAGKLYSVIPNTALGDMDVVRATTATRINSAGVIETVGVNVPRIDYTGGGCPSLLVEPQRTNRLLNSEIVATQTIATTGVQCAVSFYGTGTITFSGTFVGSLVGTGVNNRVTLVFTPSSGNLILTVSGSVTQGQLETGAFATSYIPTVASVVTRNADLISKTGISSLINSPEGTLFVEAKSFIDNGGFRIFSLSDGTQNNRISIAYSSVSNTLLAFMVINGIIVVNNNITSFNQILTNKILFKWGSGKFTVFVNGLNKFNLTSVTMPSENLLTKLSFDIGNGNNSFEGTVNSIQLYKTALTDAECVALTTL